MFTFYVKPSPPGIRLGPSVRIKAPSSPPNARLATIGRIMPKSLASPQFATCLVLGIR